MAVGSEYPAILRVPSRCTSKHREPYQSPVHGDKELLALGSYKTTRIVSAREFAAMFDLGTNP